MPWVAYTHISHTNPGRRDNATPLFAWGKYQERGGRPVLPVSVQARHSFVGRLRIGQFAEALQRFLEECGTPPGPAGSWALCRNGIVR